MEAKLCIYCCHSIVPEVSHLLNSENYRDIVVKSFPAVCTNNTHNDQLIRDMVAGDIDHFSKIIVIASSCMGSKKANHAVNKKVKIMQLEHCFEIFINRPTVYHFIKQGNYLITNGWLQNYQQHINKWRVDSEASKMLSGEALRQILLLETGLPGDYNKHLQSISSKMELPFDTLPVGNSHLQHFFDSLISTWRSEKESTTLNDRIAKIKRETAEYSLIFSQLKKLIDLTDENLIEKEIANLLDILFIPQEISFLKYHKGELTNETCYRKAVNPMALTSENTLEIDIEHQDELLGTYIVSGVQFPQFIPQYSSMKQVIGQIGGLSIENARKYSELISAKSTIADSESRFKSIMQQSPSIIEMYDTNGIQRSVNIAYEELWGFPASHTVNRFNILQSEEVKRTGLFEYVLRAYNGEAVQVPEYLFDPTGKTEAKGKGRERWLSTRIYPLKDSNNNVQNIIITHEDITNQKEATLKLDESNQKFRNLSQSATDMLNLDTLNEIYEYLTNSLYEQYPNEVILFSTIDEKKQESTVLSIKGVSQRLFDIVRKLTGFNIYEKKFKMVESHQSLFTTGKFYTFERGLYEFSGPEFPKIAAITIEKLLGIRQIYTIGIIKEEKLFATIHFFNRSKKPITDNEYIESFVKQAGIVIEQKQAAELLRKSEEKYRLITENASDVIWVLNTAKMKFTYISPAIEQLRGLTVEEALVEKMEDALTSESLSFVLNSLQKSIPSFIENHNQPNFQIYQIQQPCKNGSIIWVEVSTKIRMNVEGEIEVVGVSRNIDERMKMENKIRRSEAQLRELNATKDKFFSIIAHDLRGPFASMVSLSELLADEKIPLTREEIVDFSKSLHKTASSTYILLENLLEWSLLQHGVIKFNHETIEVKKFIENFDRSLSEMAVKKRVNFTISAPSNLVITADTNMLQTILRNLVANAIKFTESGGKVELSVQMTDPQTVLFTITDSGIGMKPEILPKLFRIDQNVSRNGTNGEPSTGLGLILCKEFVDKHGGEIWVKSVEGKGSTFSFTLPNQNNHRKKF